MKYLLLAALSIIPFHHAHAAQPISVSLAECAVIYNVTSIRAEEKGKPEQQILTMRKMSDVFKKAAYKTAVREGRDDGTSYIDAKLPALQSKWNERWRGGDDMKALSLMKKNMEWVQYCGKLGKDRGLLPLKR
jgi:hypothetical protein